MDVKAERARDIPDDRFDKKKSSVERWGGLRV